MEKNLSNKIKLDEPIKVDGVFVNEITLRKPKVKDLLMVSKIESTEEKEVTLTANLSDLPAEAIEELSIPDYLKIQSWLSSFLSAPKKN